MLLTLPFTNVACPKCNARVGQPCHSENGRKLSVRYPHMGRARAFGRKFPKPSPENCEPAKKSHL